MSAGLNGRKTVGPNYKWYVVGMLWFIAFFNYADRQAIFSVLPLLEDEMELTPVQLGWLGSSFAIVYGLGAPFAGFIVDRVRRKTAILAGLHVWSIICMATASSRNFTHLLFFRAAEGLGETFYFPASMSLVSDYHGKNTRSRAMGLHQTSVYVGTIAGGFFAGLIGQHYGWRSSFVVFGALGIVLGFVLQRILVEPKRGTADAAEANIRMPIAEKKASIRESLRTIWSTPTAVMLMGAFVCANFVGVVLLTWMPKFVYDEFSLNLAESGLTATIFVHTASLLAAPLGGWLADSLRKRHPGGRMLVQTFGVLCGAPFIVLCGTAQTLTVLIVALTAWGFFKGLHDANIFASIYEVIPPESRGAAAGFMNMVGWLGGGATAPVIVGYIAQNSSLGFAIATTSAVYVAAGIIFILGILLFVRRDSERMQARLAASTDSPNPFE
ncbi:MAG: MFS transporter [Candidatus Hydrogenedentota bacterium]